MATASRTLSASGTRVFRPSELRKMKGREQVAAVCYRVRRDAIEFLLVQTRSKRWTFPKGGSELGLTHAQAAALEAFEEAGVHGRMEETSFASYTRAERSTGTGEERQALAVHAHLCEVLRQERPQEAGRNPTWFAVEKAKRRLQEHRAGKYGAELSRVVERAVARIRQAKTKEIVPSTESRVGRFGRDGLHNVQVEAPELVRVGALNASYGYHRRIGSEQPGNLELAIAAYLSRAARQAQMNGTPRSALLPRKKLLQLVASPELPADVVPPVDEKTKRRK